MTTLYYESSITHHGVKGQKWGVRRYQNPDGSLTSAGRKHSKLNRNKLAYGTGLPDNGKTRKAEDYSFNLRSSKDFKQLVKSDKTRITKKLEDLDRLSDEFRNVEWAKQMKKDADSWISKSESVKLKSISDFYKNHGDTDAYMSKSKNEKLEELGKWDSATYDQYNVANILLNKHGGYEQSSKFYNSQIDKTIKDIDDDLKTIRNRR